MTSAFSRAASLTQHKGAPGLPLQVFALVFSHVWVCGCSQQDSRPQSSGFSVLPASGAAVGTHSAIFSFVVLMLRSQVNLSHLPVHVQTRSLWLEGVMREGAAWQVVQTWCELSAVAQGREGTAGHRSWLQGKSSSGQTHSCVLPSPSSTATSTAQG